MRSVKHHAFLFIGLLATCELSQIASANTTTQLSYQGSAVFNNLAVGYDTGWVAPNPNYQAGTESSPQAFAADVYIGGDSVLSSNSNSLLNTWCVDIYHWSANVATYDVDTPSYLASYLENLRPATNNQADGQTRVNDLILLADERYSTISNSSESAAFQLAIWDIAYGTGTNNSFGITSTDPGFNVDATTANSNAAQLADNWLASLETASLTGNHGITFFDGSTHQYTQNLIAFAPLASVSYTNNVSTVVPEPEQWAMLLLGLTMLVLGLNRKHI